MADVFIRGVAGGEKTTPSTTDVVEIDTGVVSQYVTLENVFKVIDGLTEDTSPDPANDPIATYDNSASGAKKVKNWVHTTALQTLTNKTLDLASNTLAGTTAQFNTALSDGDFATLAGSETLTNKTLTAPVINNATGLWQPRYIIKAADETVNNSATLQDDADFVFAIGANEKWMVEAWLIITSVSVNSDFKMGFTAPASCTAYWARSSPPANTANGGGWGGTVSTNAPLAIRTVADSVSGGSANLTFGFQVAGFFYNSTNAGNIQLQWCQDTATAEDTKVLANSVMRYTRIA